MRRPRWGDHGAETAMRGQSWPDHDGFLDLFADWHAYAECTNTLYKDTLHRQSSKRSSRTPGRPWEHRGVLAIGWLNCGTGIMEARLKRLIKTRYSLGECARLVFFKQQDRLTPGSLLLSAALSLSSLSLELFIYSPLLARFIAFSSLSEAS